MPIRFRCEHCHQLLGIARRKAGSRVECPTCHARVLVPPTDAVADLSAHTGVPAPAGAEEPLFERSDFDKVLQAPGGDEPSVLAQSSKNAPSPRPAPGLGNGPLFENPPYDVERIEPPPLSVVQPPDAGVPLPSGVAPAPPPPGYVLTPGRASLLAVLGVLLLALAFGAGLYVGRYVL